jgi:tRNA(Ile)-lysidine synthase
MSPSARDARGPEEHELTASEFEALMASFGPFEARPVLAVAVSGGRDSLCLAVLAHAWAAARGGAVVGLIVDHGLRASSAEEAEVAHRLLAGHGIDAEILRWPGDKPRHGIQEEARAARYDLLLEACRRRGILHLLVAHHAGDQAETVAMRAARRSGPDGLAGMAALAEQRNARVLRPLLTVPRDRLTATLVACGIVWFDDPSNTDPRFERARLRAGGAPASVDVGHGTRRSEVERKLAEAAVAALEFDVEGGVAIDLTALRQMLPDLAMRLVSRVVQALGHRDHPPRRDRLERALARLSLGPISGKSGKSQDLTLCGCHLMLRQAPEDRRLRWIVKAETGRKSHRNGGQPLVPAAFFACGGSPMTHLDCQPHPRT